MSMSVGVWTRPTEKTSRFAPPMMMVEKRLAVMPTSQSAWERQIAASSRPCLAEAGSKWSKASAMAVFVMLASQRRWQGSLHFASW